MIPNLLILRNFMCYRSLEAPQELNLDGISIACLSGDNGAGKSALLDAITWALWGKARMSDDELVAMGADEMEVELRFALDRQEYRVLRKYQRGSGKRSGKGTLELQVCSGAVWKTLSELQKSQTQERIIELLRMRYDTFINSAFLLQGRADEFTRKPPGERKQVLADILDLQEYARLEERAKVRVKALSEQLSVLEARIVDLRAEADKQAIYLQARDEAQQRVELLAAERDRAAAVRERAVERVQALMTKRERRDERARDLAQLTKDQQARRQSLEDMAAAIAAAEATLGRRDEIAAGAQALRDARAELRHLDDLRPAYDQLDERRRELKDQLKDAIRTLQEQIARANDALARLQTQAERLQSLHTQSALLATQVAAFGPLDAEREQIAADRFALDERAARLNDFSLRRERLSGAIKLKQDSLVATREERQRLLKRLDRELADLSRWQQELVAANEQAALLVTDEARLLVLRDQSQSDGDMVGQRRAECKQLKEQADSIKERQGLLAPGQATCPVCRSDLGHDGIEDVRAHYDQELRELRSRYAAAKTEADAGDTRLKALRADIATLERQVSARQPVAAQAPALEQRIAAAAATQRERDECQQDLDTVLRQIKAKEFDPKAQMELAQVEAELASLGSGPDAVKAERAALAKREQELARRQQEQSNLRATLAANEREMAELASVPADLIAAEQQAAELQRALRENDFAHAIRTEGREVEAEIRTLGYTRETHAAAREDVRTLEPWDAEQRTLELALREIDLRRNSYADLWDAATLADTAIREREAEIAELDAALLALRGVEAERRTAEEQERAATRNLDGAQKDLGYKESLLEKAEQAAADLMARENERRDLLERKGVFEELRDAYGKKGIQAMLIETAIPEIEREANSLLGGMTDNQMHVAIKTQETNKSGNVAETLEIEVGDTLGTRVYDAFSGGEAFRVNFAIRIALSKLLARRAGARLETLVIDEGFGALDAQGRERMVEAITSIQGDFKRILVITHIQEMKDLFPAQIEITKTPHGSVWQMA